MSHQGDWSWSVEALYACPCGALVAAQRWRWIDCQVRPDLVATLRANGPFVGACSRCRRPASGSGAWLEVAPDRESATLVLSADRRGDLIAALQAHLGDLQARMTGAAPWLLQPAVAFAPAPSPWDAEAETSLAPWPGALGPETIDGPVGDLAREPGPANGAAADAARSRALSPSTTSAAGTGPIGHVSLGGSDPGGEDLSLHDTLPGRRRARRLPLQEIAGASGGAGSAAAGDREVEPAVAKGSGPKPAAVLGAGEMNMSGGAGRRPAAVLDAGVMNMSEGAGRRASATPAGGGRRAAAGATNMSEGSGLRRAPGPEAAGANGRRRDPEAAGVAPIEHDGEPAPAGERTSLRAAVARALTPAHPEGHESGPRPAAVLPGPGAEASAGETGTWPKRQGEAGESGPGEAGETGTWPKRQAIEEAEAPRMTRASRTPTPPVRLGPEVQRSGLAALGREGGAVQVTATTMNEATARVWATAPVKVRPIHLRGLGYPLVGVRCVAEVAGEALIVDAVVDVGAPTTLEIFKQLTREFRVRLVAPGGTVDRELVAPELQRNAAACLESAQAQLGTGEFPHDAFRTACEALAGRNPAQRLEPARASLPETLGEGCRASAATAWAALERLEQASRKDNLARLLEVDGLSVETYEKIRSAVLAAAIEFGLPAPARFWRRWLGSSQARDVGTFVQKLIAARSASIARGEDLAADQVEAAWRGILDLCQHKNLTPPPDVSRALGLGKVSAGRRPSQPQITVAADVREPPPVQEGPRSEARRRELASRLKRSPSEGDVRAVIGALAELAEADVVSLLPALAEHAQRAVPELLTALRAPQRHVRQTAAILLGHLGERKAEGPLVTMLGEEPSAGWVDAAAALGNLGPRVVGPLCGLLRTTPASRKDSVGARVARALVELIRAEGAGPGGSARLAVENLLEVGDPSVSSAARRALATLGAVRDEVDGDDAEASRRFSRLASDAIAPELDAAADDEIDEVEVEVGD